MSDFLIYANAMRPCMPPVQQLIQ